MCCRRREKRDLNKKSRIFASCLFLESLKSEANFFDKLHFQTRARITSYNVCYTKLLRIVAQANTTGFEKLFIKTLLGANGAVRIEDRFQETLTSIQIQEQQTGRAFEFGKARGRKYRPGVEHADKVIEAIYQFKNVIAASKVIRGGVEVSNNFKEEPAQP